jgi:hypothetical protein
LEAGARAIFGSGGRQATKRRVEVRGSFFARVMSGSKGLRTKRSRRAFERSRSGWKLGRRTSDAKESSDSEEERLVEGVENRRLRLQGDCLSREGPWIPTRQMGARSRQRRSRVSKLRAGAAMWTEPTEAGEVESLSSLRDKTWKARKLEQAGGLGDEEASASRGKTLRAERLCHLTIVRGQMKTGRRTSRVDGLGEPRSALEGKPGGAREPDEGRDRGGG